MIAYGAVAVQRYSNAMAHEDWSDLEIDAIVADYFSMLVKELTAQPYNKADHRRALLKLIDRGEGAIEFKHQNISAVLMGLGHPWINGYKPASNFQGALIDGVVRYLQAHPDWLEPGEDGAETIPTMVKENRSLVIGAPPATNTQPNIDLNMMHALAGKFDVAGRDAKNRRLGQAGERLVLDNERASLRSAGRPDLAAQVIWTANEQGDGAGFDIASFELDGRPRLIEVKTTNGWERTPFFLTRNELAVANANAEVWHLVRVWDFSRNAKAFGLRPPLDEHVELTPANYLARLH